MINYDEFVIDNIMYFDKIPSEHINIVLSKLLFYIYYLFEIKRINYANNLFITSNDITCHRNDKYKPILSSLSNNIKITFFKDDIFAANVPELKHFKRPELLDIFYKLKYINCGNINKIHNITFKDKLKNNVTFDMKKKELILPYNNNIDLNCIMTLRDFAEKFHLIRVHKFDKWYEEYKNVQVINNIINVHFKYDDEYFEGF